MFPFTLKAHEAGDYIAMPPGRKSFLKAKPSELIWYAFDVEVKKDKKANFTVYDMRDFGGIGDVIAHLSDVELDDDDFIAACKKYAMNEARYQEREEYDQRRKDRINVIYKDLMSSMGLKRRA